MATDFKSCSGTGRLHAMILKGRKLMNEMAPPWAVPAVKAADGGGVTGNGDGQPIGNDGDAKLWGLRYLPAADRTAGTPPGGIHRVTRQRAPCPGDAMLARLLEKL